MSKAIIGSPLKLNFHQSLYKIDPSLFVESWSTPKTTGYFLNYCIYLQVIHFNIFNLWKVSCFSFL